MSDDQERQVVVTSITGCARCHGSGHDDLPFERLTHPMEFGDQLFATHWAMCPRVDEPIMMIILRVEDVELTDTQRSQLQILVHLREHPMDAGIWRRDDCEALVRRGLARTVEAAGDAYVMSYAATDFGVEVWESWSE